MQWLGLVLLAIAVGAGPAMAASNQGAPTVAGLRFSVFDPFMLARVQSAAPIAGPGVVVLRPDAVVRAGQASAATALSAPSVQSMDPDAGGRERVPSIRVPYRPTFRSVSRPAPPSCGPCICQ